MLRSCFLLSSMITDNTSISASLDESNPNDDEEENKQDLALEPLDTHFLGEGFGDSSCVLNVGRFCVSNIRFGLVPESFRRIFWPKTVKFIMDDVCLLPESGEEFPDVEMFQVKVPDFRVVGFSSEQLSVLKKLEICMIPPRPSVYFSGLNGIKCLVKLSIRHFSIRYIPTEIVFLEKLEVLDLSYNKLKNLPSALSRLSSLKSLRVANNKLSFLPVDLSNLSQLEELDLSNNRITSLEPMKFTSFPVLRVLNIQSNLVPNFSQIPPRTCYHMEHDNFHPIEKSNISLIDVDNHDMDIRMNSGSESCISPSICHSSLRSEAMSVVRCHTSQRLSNGWNNRDSLQELARQERLTYRRKWKGSNSCDQEKIMAMAECNNSCWCSMMETEGTESCFHEIEERQSELSPNVNSFSGNKTDTIDSVGFELIDFAERSSSSGCLECNITNLSDDDCISDVTSDSAVSDKPFRYENELESNIYSISQANQDVQLSESSSVRISKESFKSKRQYDIEIDNPKPRKFRRPEDEHLHVSFKYSSESFCSVNDHLPDGFYDAGRDRPFRPLEDYLENSCTDSREVILLDRERDEELEAIVLSAQMLLDRLIFFNVSTGGRKQLEVHNFQRASMLSLFVSDCFGGTDRSASVMRMRKSIVGSKIQQPFICTCSSLKYNHENKKVCLETCDSVGSYSFSDLCENSLRIIKESRNSNVVPIGSLRFGVCRHRAVLMKYLCDRMDPPIPCELVRGYLDFLPHAWNAILVKRGTSWSRMIVDTCYPTDIRHQADPEYFCRYIPLSRVLAQSLLGNPSLVRCSFPPLSLLPQKTGTTSHEYVWQCKFGTLDAAAKIKDLNLQEASDEEAKIFEFTFLGEVRMLCALRNHRCIVEIYGHQLSSKWVGSANRNGYHRLLKSIIVMEYISGGSLKGYVDRLSKQGVKHVPANLAIHIAREVACALVEVHSKQIIHRDIKSENILIDLGRNNVDGSPVVKLSDFDRAVPLQSFRHTCCIAHLGIHPPDVCVGTPRWMAPEVLQAMHGRFRYGLEVDIWSFGCVLFELLTLQIPYEGLSDAEIYNLLELKQRPELPSDFKELLSSNDFTGATSLTSSGNSHTDHQKLKLLVKLFYQCTSSDPAERPTARQIHEMLHDI